MCLPGSLLRFRHRPQQHECYRTSSIGRDIALRCPYAAARRPYLVRLTAFVQQSQLLPQLHALPLFIGQFLPVFLHDGWSAANALAQMIAAKIEKIILPYFFMPRFNVAPRLELRE